MDRANSFFFFQGFFDGHSRLARKQKKGEVISLIPLYHFYSLQKHLDIGRTITAGSLLLQIAGS